MVTYLLDVEEQQKKITTQQIRETEIRNLAANTQATASVLRGDAAQQQNRRTTEQATRGSGEPARSSGEPAPRGGEPAPSGASSQLFDNVMDTAPDATMGEIDAVMENKNAKKKRH